MSSRRQLSRAVLAVVLAAIPIVQQARAQTETTTPDADPRRAAAQARFDEGVSLAKAREWEAALNAFLESRQLFATRSATRNAAIALRQLARFSEALDLYDVLLRDFGGSMSRDLRGAYEAERQALREHVGELELSVNEPGAAVVVDGQQRGVTPLTTTVRLDAGVHTLRISKASFETFEQQVVVVGTERRRLQAKLNPQVGTGTLVVIEQRGETLDVVLDAAVVGRSPFEGGVSAGLHSVLLRDASRGTQPTSVEVKARQTSTLVLRAVALDAEVLVRPKPADATVFIDGVFAGNGAWTGRLPSGPHRFEIVAPGRLPFRRDLRLGAGRTLIDATLQTNPSPSDGPSTGAPKSSGGVRSVSRFYVEPRVGLLLARSLGSAADATCDCSQRSRPFGAIGQLSFGYSLSPHLGLELAVGYLSLAEDSTRTTVANGEPDSSPFRSQNYRDSTTLVGPLSALALSARFLRKTPLTARLLGGLAALGASSSGVGTFTGALEARDASSTRTGRVQFEEPRHDLWTPLFATELDVGYQLSSRLSLDLSLALYLFLPSEVLRSRRLGLLDGERAFGVFTLDEEAVAGPFLALSPALSARFTF